MLQLVFVICLHVVLHDGEQGRDLTQHRKPELSYVLTGHLGCSINVLGQE